MNLFIVLNIDGYMQAELYREFESESDEEGYYYLSASCRENPNTPLLAFLTEEEAIEFCKEHIGYKPHNVIKYVPEKK